MTALFNRLGVDYIQWKAVSRTLLRTDFRVPMSQSGETYSLHTIRGVAMAGAVHGFIGLASAIVVFVSRDVLLTATIVLAYLAFVLVTTLMTQHSVTLLSQHDYLVLAPRPVSSRTFLAIRLTNVLFHAGLITTFMAVPPIVAFGVAYAPRVAVAAALAIYAWAVALTLAVSATYGAVLQFVGSARLQRALGYMQLVMGLLMYGGMLFATRLFGNGGLDGVTLREPWPWSIPPAWYASYLQIATGTATPAIWGRAVLSLGVVVAIFVALRGRLGVDYASRFADLSESTETASARGTQSRARTLMGDWLLRSGEARAAGILIVAHFRHDLRVRMGVLGVLPLLLLYLYLGGEDSAIDPFVTASRRSTDFIALAVLIFPAVLTRHFASSDAHSASWIYTVTTADRPKLVIAAKNVAVAYFLVPFLLLVSAVYTWRFGHAGHAIAHTVVLGLVSHVALQGSVALSGHPPFSRPPEKISGGAGLFAWMIVVIFGGQLLVWALPRFVYVSWSRVGAVIATLVAVTWGLNRVIAWRVRLTPS